MDGDRNAPVIYTLPPGAVVIPKAYSLALPPADLAHTRVPDGVYLAIKISVEVPAELVLVKGK